MVHITSTPHFGAIRELYRTWGDLRDLGILLPAVVNFPSSVPASNNEVRFLWPLPLSDFYDGVMAIIFEWFLVSEGLGRGERG